VSGRTLCDVEGDSLRCWTVVVEECIPDTGLHLFLQTDLRHVDHIMTLQHAINNGKLQRLRLANANSLGLIGFNLLTFNAVSASCSCRCKTADILKNYCK